MLPEYPAAFWVCAVGAVLLIGVAKAGFGGGVGILATPLLALMVSVADAAALLLPLLIACDVFAVKHYRSTFDKQSVKRLLPGSVFGIGAGAFFLAISASTNACSRWGWAVWPWSSSASRLGERRFWGLCSSGARVGLRVR